MFLKDIFIENGVTIPMNYDSIKIDIKKAYSYKLRGYYEELKKVVEDKGGKLISDYYLGNNIKLTYECNKGHRWEAVPFSIVLHNTWCPTCKGGIKYNIERVREIAKKRGDKCLSDDYKNSMSKLKFKCKNGHISETRFQYYKKLVEGTWCPECRPNIKRERDENGRFV